MRHLIHELPYETPLAAGRYQYAQAGQPTGTLESWRLTAAVDGYRLLRVDLDARAAASGDSYLYHLMLNPAGTPERLNFRFFRPGRRIDGTLLFEPGRVTLAADVNGARHEATAHFPAGTLFWFPATAGLGLLAGLAPAGAANQPALTLDKAADFAPLPVQLSARPGPPETLMVMGRARPAHPLTLTWTAQQRTIWLDEHHWPLKMARGPLTATATRYVRFA